MREPEIPLKICVMDSQGRQPHVLVIPFLAQGHVAPLMKLSHKIVDHGIKVTFVNTEFIHAKVTASMAVKGEEKSPIRLVSIPNGLEPGDDRNDALKLTQSMLKVISPLEGLD